MEIKGPWTLHSSPTPSNSYPTGLYGSILTAELEIKSNIYIYMILYIYNIVIFVKINIILYPQIK